MPQYDKPNIYQSVIDTGIYNTPTLAEQKMANLAQKTLDKKTKINPNLLPETEEERYQRIYGDVGGGSNILDAAQSSLTQAAGNLYDTGHNMYGRAAEKYDLPTMEKTSPELDKWSDVAYADKLRGYDPTQYNQEMEQISQNVGQGNYGDALLQAGMNMPETLARSAGPMAELIGGTAVGALFGGPVGAVAANAGKLGKLGNAITNGIKMFRNGSIYGADMANKYATEYEKETGQQKPATEVASDFAIATVLGVAEFNIFKGIAKEATVGTFTKTAKDLLASANVTQGVLTNLAKTVLRNGTPILEAMGKEGLQEYFETWHEIIASSNKEMGVQFANAANQHEALTGAVIGMGTGGSAAAAPKVVSTAATTALNVGTRTVGKGVEKGIDYAHKKAVEANYKVISQDKRDEIQATYKDNAAAYKKSEDANNAAASSIKNTTTVDELKALNDPEVDVAIDSILDSDNKIKERRKSIYEAESFKDLEVDAWTVGKIAAINSSNESKVDYSLEEMKDRLQAEITNSYTPADLNANIDKIKNEAIAQYNKRNTADKAALEAIRAKDFVYQASKNLYEGTKAAVEKALPKALRDEIVKQAKAGVDLAKVGIDVATAELKNLDKSTARAMLDDLTKGKMHKGIDTFSRKQLGELKTAFKNNEKATKVLNKAIERKNKISAEFDKVTKKDMKFFDAVVDAAGKIKNSNIAAQIRGLGIITEDFLTDSGNLSRAKSLVKELEKAKKEDPTKFSKSDQARLYDNKRKVLKAIRNEEQGAINNALRKIDKALTKNQVERRSIIALKQAKNKIVSLSKKTYTSLEESELLKNLNKSLEDLSKKLEEYGDDVDVAPEAKAKPKKSTTEKVDVTEDVVEVVNSSEVSEKELAEILEDSSTIEADNEVSTAPDKPLDDKLTKKEIAKIDLLDSMFCNKG